jgi:hypothetical protein
MGDMAMSYEDALEVQRRHEGRLLRLPGVTSVGVKRSGEDLVLEVAVDPDAAMPDELNAADLDGLPLKVERRRYDLQ